MPKTAALDVYWQPSCAASTTPRGSAQALASTVNIFGQPCLYCDRACPSISRSSSDRATEPCSTLSPAPHGRHDDAGDWEFESSSLQRRVLCEPDFLNRGAENIAERWPTLACKANIARARELIAASVAVTDPPAEHDDPDLDVSAVEILPGARHRCEALTAPDGRPGRIHRAARSLGLKARDGAAARLRE